METTGHLPFRVRGYCGTCGKEFGPARPSCFGYRIKCDDGHLAQVIAAGRTAAWWLRREAWLLKWQTFYSPFAVVRRFWPSLEAGTFILIFFGVLFSALASEAASPEPCMRWLWRGTIGFILVWRFVDLFLSNSSITFTTRFPQSPLRSVVFSLAAYLQVVLCYSYFYCVLSDPKIGGITLPEPSDKIFNLVQEAVYYSFGTIATVGYGALEPDGLLGKVFVSSELVAGLYFVVIILAQVSAWSSHSKVELGRFPWEGLQEESRE